MRARERKGTDEEGTEKRMNPVLQGDGGREHEEARERIKRDGKRGRTNNERRGTRGKKALVQACLVS